MSYTINDVAHIIDTHQTAAVIEAIEDYLNKGTIPPFDPCLSCEPNYIRQLIAKIQTAEATGEWPPKKAAPKAKAKTKTEPVDLDEGGYIADTMTEEQVAEQMAKRPEMFGNK